MKSNVYKYIWVILLFFIIGCTKEEGSFRTSEFETPKISGYYCRTDRAILKDIVGVPNVILEKKSLPYSLIVFPNPAENSCMINLRPFSDGINKKIWITPAEFEKPIPENAITLGMNNIRVGGMPVYQNEFTTEAIRINISSFEEGYYRVYLKVEGELFYDNLIVSKNSES
jgi:hypothetical protein